MGEPTIRDVARVASVSVASVSRALNGLANVHPDTRTRVLEAVRTLGYVPHAGARSLSTARTRTLGVVLPDLHGEFFSELARGLDRETSARGYQLVLSSMHAEVERAGQAMRAMRGRVDGLVVMAPQVEADALAATLPQSLPVVLINSADTGQHHSFRIDGAAGAEQAVAHLAGDGRRRIAHVAGPQANLDAQDRCRGYVAALARHLPGAEPWILDGDFTETSGATAVDAMLAADAPPDAIFAANDGMALGALVRLRAAGVDVPGGIAIVGFDDVPTARYMGLSTISARTDEIGARAAARLIDLIESRAAAPEEERIEPALIVRDTSRSRDA